MSKRPKVTLTAGGIGLSKWRSYEVEADLLTPADAFHFVAPNIDGAYAGVIKPESAVRVTIDGTPVMVGNVDEVTYDVSEGEGSGIEISGRDRGRFLQDCSAAVVRLHGKTLVDLAQVLAGDWVPIWYANRIAASALPRVKKMKVDPGETVLDCLNRFAAQAKVIIWLDEKGQGVIGRPNYSQAPSFALYRYLPGTPNAIRNNVEKGRVTESSKDSYSQVTCLSAMANGSKGGLLGGGRSLLGGTRGKGASKLRGAVVDSTVLTHKPRVINGAAVNAKQARVLAEEEIERAKFGAWRGVYTTPGHYNNGKLWQIDRLCTLVDQVAGVDGTYYVVRRRFTCDESGPKTEVELRPSGVYLVD